MVWVSYEGRHDHMILFCDVSVPDKVGEVNTDDFEMNMVLLKT